MRRRHEAAGEPHSEDRHAGLEQELPGALEAQAEIVARRRLADIFAEEALELARRQAGLLGEGGAGERLLEVALHELRNGEDLGVGDAKPGAQLHALAL